MIYIKYFVHGTTFDNLEKKASGWNEAMLAPKGIEQAKALAETIKDEPFDIVISSDLQRAIDSANIDFAGRNIEILHDSRIRECNYGDLTRQDNSLVDYSKHIIEPFPNGESMQDVEKRISDFISYLKANFDGKRVALVAHKAPQLALDVLIKGKSWERAIAEDWRITKAWQPGWEYIIK